MCCLSRPGCSILLWKPELTKTPGLHFTGSAGAVLRLSRWGQEEAGDQTEVAAPVPAREAVGLGLSGSGEAKRNARNVPMQTDTFNSSNWGSAEYIPVIPSHGFLTVYLFQGPKKQGAFFFFFFFPQSGFGRCFCSSPKHVLQFPETDFLHHRGKLHLVQTASFICFQKLI